MKELKSTFLKYLFFWIGIIFIFFTCLFTHIYNIKTRNHVDSRIKELNRFNYQLNNKITDILELIKLVKQEKYIKCKLENTHIKSSTRDIKVKSLLKSLLFVSKASITYILNRNGDVVLSTDVNGKDILKGKNYRFRPYFTRALLEDIIIYPAIGVTTGERGIYFSTPITSLNDNKTFIGVAVVKISLKDIDNLIAKQSSPTMLISPEKIIFSTNRPDWLYKSMNPLPDTVLYSLKNNRQFAGIDHKSINFMKDGDSLVKDNIRYEIIRRNIIIPNWEFVTLNPTDTLPELSDVQVETLIMIYSFIFILILIVFFLIVNILKRKNTESRLKQSEHKFRAIFNQTFQYVGLIDLDGRLLELNKTALTTFNSPKDEILGKFFWEIPWISHCPDQRDNFKENIARALKGEFIRFESTHFTRDNKEIFVDTSLTPIKDEQGNIIMVIPEGRDITNRVMAERKLIQSERKYKNLYKSMHDPYVRTNIHGEIIEYNKSFKNMVNFSEGDLENKNFLSMIPVEWHAIEKLNKDKAISESYSDLYEMELLSEDGQTISIELRIYLSRDEKGTPNGFWRFIRDISERKRTQEIITQTEKMISLGGLAAGMAHEINNPLGIILQSIQIINMKLKSKSGDKSNTNDIIKFLKEKNIFDYLDAIENAGKRSASIISNMLKFSMPGKKNHTPVDINKLLDITLDLAGKNFNLKKNYDFKNINIIKDYQPSMENLVCEETEIEQVIFNLLTNSAHATLKNPLKDRPPIIKITSRSKGLYAIIEIEDNGPGIDKNTIKHIFEPFFTTKPVGEGTGLGLSVSYSIITNNHNGEMTVESEKDRGTMFRIKIPFNNKKE